MKLPSLKLAFSGAALVVGSNRQRTRYFQADRLETCRPDRCRRPYLNDEDLLPGPHVAFEFCALRCHERLLGPLVGSRNTCSGKSWESARISSQSVSKCLIWLQVSIFNVFVMAVVIYDFWVSFHPKSDKTNFHLISLVSGSGPSRKKVEKAGEPRGQRCGYCGIHWKYKDINGFWYHLHGIGSWASLKGSCFKWKWCHVLRCRTNWGSDWKSRGLNRFFTTSLKGNCLRMSAIILRIIKREAPLDGTRDTCLQLPSTAQCVIISMFHFSIPQVFQLIQWSKTMHLLLTLRSHKRFHRGRRGFGFGWQLCSQAWDQRVGDGTARLDGPNLASYDCGVPNLHHGIPWKCTVNKPTSKTLNKAKSHNARCFWPFQEAETDVQMEARRQLTHRAQYRTRFPILLWPQHLFPQGKAISKTNWASTSRFRGRWLVQAV